MNLSKTVLVKTRTIKNKKTNETTNKTTVNSTVNTIGKYIVTTQRLGRGSSATVYLGHHVLSKVSVAVKKFELTNNNKRIERRAWREIKILQNIQHPNIIKMYDYHYDKEKNDIYIFLEYCHCGSIKHFLGKGGYLDEKYANHLMRQFISGLKYLFSRGIYHRDIKPDNLLLSKNYNIKISDFGLSTMNTSGKFNRLCGSPLYMAPEILISTTYNKRSDLWSIGLVMFELLFGHHPLRHVKHIAELIKYFNEKPTILIPPREKPDDVNLTKNCIDLLQKILNISPDERITWEELFNHPWISISLEKEKNVKNTKYDNDKDPDEYNKDDDKEDHEDTRKNMRDKKEKSIYISTEVNDNDRSNKNNLSENTLSMTWSPLYLQIIRWKYNKNSLLASNDINYEINDTHYEENTYMGHESVSSMSNSICLNKKWVKKCLIIQNEITSTELSVVKNKKVVISNVIQLSCSVSNSLSIELLLKENIDVQKEKLCHTESHLNPKETTPILPIGCQTWPLSNLVNESFVVS